VRVVVVTKEGMDYSRGVNDWLREFERRVGKELEVVDPETREGVGFAEVYGVVEYPTILALSDEGKLMNSWRGQVLPKIDEVSYYAGDGLSDGREELGGE